MGCSNSKLSQDLDPLDIPPAVSSNINNNNNNNKNRVVSSVQPPSQQQPAPPTTTAQQQQSQQQLQQQSVIESSSTPSAVPSSSLQQQQQQQPTEDLEKEEIRSQTASATTDTPDSFTVAAPQPNPPPSVVRRKSLSPAPPPSSSSSTSRLAIHNRINIRGGNKKTRNGGGGGNHNNNNSSSLVNGIHNNNNDDMVLPPATRVRVDSWSKPDPPAAAAANNNNNNNKLGTVEQQWKFLWKTQSPYLLDPADVTSVLGMMRNNITNRLAPAEVTLLLRKIRFILKTAAITPPNTGSKKIVGRVFAANNYNNSNNTTSSKAELLDAKNLAQQQHLLTFAVLQRLWKPRIIDSSSSSASSSSTATTTTTNVLENAYWLLMYLSETLWPRVAEVARQTATTAKLDMDVNHSLREQWNMPKPSSVPDLAEPPILPAGVSFANVVFFTALARRSPRPQRLQLLFYLCMPTEQLKEFLNSHPAGGVPCWLLEVGQGLVVSLASLTHYHYFGTAFLPHETGSKEGAPSGFVRSSSRNPVTIPASNVRNLVYKLLSTNNPDWEEPNEGENNMGLSPAVSPNRRQNQIFIKRISSQEQIYINSFTYLENSEELGGGLNGSKEEAAFPPSDVMRVLQEVTHDYDDADLVHAAAQLELERNSGDSTAVWTLEDFRNWADRELSDLALDACFHRLFGSMVLPSFSTELDLVVSKWNEWTNFWHDKLLENGVKMNGSSGSLHSSSSPSTPCSVFGGLGGIDGLGGMGYGVLYCVDKQWWNQWVAYTGFGGELRRTLYRPGDLSNERLLEKDWDIHLPGSLGSFEPMKEGLVPNQDYVLVPPNVWDVLFEMYSGGPPLPRMVLSSRDGNTTNNISNHHHRSDEDGSHRFKWINTIPVAIRPWIIHCSLCDPLQPYRRGDAGTLNIRIMALPNQPLWRVLGEILTRLPLTAHKAYDPEGRGMGRLWKKVEPAPDQKEPGSRYGPWNLVCKNRFAILPMMTLEETTGDFTSSATTSLEDILTNWYAYTDHATVEESGIVDGDQIMFEFSVLNKNGKLIWPREAAAKAGRVRRLAEEDTEFRNTLQGLDKDGNMVLKPSKLVGMDVDAMDSTGRWYLVQILDVDIVDEETDEEGEDFDKMKASDGKAANHNNNTKARKKVKVDFNGHVEWIDVESDRLAKAGRFTNEAEQQESVADGKAGANTSKEPEPKANKGTVTVKKTSTVDSTAGENMKLCPFPGFGACGLTNLGNTCYVNSAVQCISYLPLLRSYLLSAQYKTSGDLNRDNPLGTGGRLLEEFADLLRAMWSAKCGEKMPKNFRLKLGNINSQFSAGDQQDGQEFLNYMMDVLHEDSNRVRKKPYVEALEDEWVARTHLPRVGDEAWRRFLRRNQSIMADVAMGQVLNTVTCPVCKYSSRNFDPFNLLSIPVPTVADVIFQCVVIRRATATNTPWLLNKSRKGERKGARFTRRQSKGSQGPPSDSFVAEQYVVAMSRLADSSDLRQRIQKACGIPVLRLRLCRAEVVVVNTNVDEESVVRTQTKIVPVTEKEGPCSQLAKKKGPHEDVAAPTLIVAFESTLRPRSFKSNSTPGPQESLDDTADEEEEPEASGNDLLPSPKEEKTIRRNLEVYGDEKECRIVDSDPLVLAKALSRSLWPRHEGDLKLGLRVDAKDKRGSWFQGSVIEIVEKEVEEEEEEEGVQGEPVRRREVVVHFDNFAKKWDETYTMEHFEEGRVRPLYSHAVPKMKPTDFLVHHRYTDRETGDSTFFGQPFYVQCYNEWSNARAGAQILAQASRFLQYNSDWSSPIDLDDPSSMDRENKTNRLYERAQTAISDLIDLLVDFDREHIRLGLGLSTQSADDENSQPFRNPSFDVTTLSQTLVKKVNALLHRLPFEIRVAGIESTQSPNNPNADPDEEIYPFSLVRTIGNFLNARQIIILHWRDHVSAEKKPIPPGMKEPILYVPLPVEVEESGMETLRKSQKAGKERAKRARPGSSGIDLGVCLTEFCKTQNLTLDDNWRCPQCKDFRQGRQHMNLWRLPDLLTFHIKRFNMSARWREKISTKVNFPLTGLDLSEWCHKQSPVIQQDSPDSHIYDLIGVMNHYGSMTGGHYVATCKATACGKDGREEVAFSFNGLGTTLLETEGSESATGWRLGRAKVETNPGKESATLASRAAAESTEPLWLQFDDEVVDPIPPRQVVSEMAYVLFYRRRRITPSNIAKYSTLE